MATFDTDSIRRITDAVRDYERTPTESIQGTGTSQQSFSRRYFFARVQGQQAVSANRYSYQFVEITKNTAGYGNWIDKTGGITGTCYNLIEDQNSTTGTLGNGVPLAAVGACNMKLIPVGTRIMVFWTYLANGNVEYWTQYENGVAP